MAGLSLVTRGMLTKSKEIFVGGAGVGLNKYDDQVPYRVPEIHVTKFNMSDPKTEVTEDMVQIVSAKISIE